ncbi:MAG: glutamine synthetase, partial [Alphaproteobacteria bacterium]
MTNPTPIDANLPIAAARGVESMEAARAWCRARGVEDIECIVPDMAGVARGKLMPAEKFFKA